MKLFNFIGKSIIFLGMVSRGNSTKEVVVSSGFDDTTGSKTEILDLETLTWREGPAFPTGTNIYDGAPLQYKNSFLVSGGLGPAGNSDEIWFFDPNYDSWVLTGRMQMARRFHASALILADQN